MINKKGQTLLEVIIAIVILTVGVISIVTLSITSQIMARKSSYTLIATNLAREGIEYARYVRDSNWLEIEAGSLEPDQWDYKLYSYNATTGKYDYASGLNFNPTSVVGGIMSIEYIWWLRSIDDAAAKIYIDPNNYYRQNVSSFEETPYNRIIAFNPICSDGTDEQIIDGLACFGNCDDCATTYGSGYEKIGIQVVSHVQWTDNDTTYDKKLEEKLYAWKE